MKKFIREMLEDDTHQICVGRVSLILGLCLTVITSTVYMGVAIEMTWAEAALRASPGIMGLVAYIFTRAFEAKEWIAETSEKFLKKSK